MNTPAVALNGLPITAQANLEGKELRFGMSAGPTWAVATTATSNGSVNAMHDSLNPLTGLAPMIGMWLNVIFGGCGVGMLNMFLFVVVAVFLAGMMVGRTPEYLARKIESHEMKLALLTILSHPMFILGGIALFAATSWGRDTLIIQAATVFLRSFTSSAQPQLTTARASKGLEITRRLGISLPGCDAVCSIHSDHRSAGDCWIAQHQASDS